MHNPCGSFSPLILQPVSRSQPREGSISIFQELRFEHIQRCHNKTLRHSLQTYMHRSLMKTLGIVINVRLRVMKYLRYGTNGSAHNQLRITEYTMERFESWDASFVHIIDSTSYTIGLVCHPKELISLARLPR